MLARDHTVLGPNTVRAHLVHKDAARPATLDMTLDDFWMRSYTDLGVRATIRAPIRRNGVVAQRPFRRSSSSHSALAKSVFTSPGATQLTRTPFGPHSPARLRHSAKSAAFEMP